jgi:hypothetical protein
MFEKTRRFFFSTVIALPLASLDVATAEDRLTDDQMGRVTAGVLATAVDSNAFFEARAMAEGSLADASAEVGIDFARAQGEAESVGTASVKALSSAETVGTPPRPVNSVVEAPLNRLGLVSDIMAHIQSARPGGGPVSDLKAHIDSARRLSR